MEREGQEWKVMVAWCPSPALPLPLCHTDTQIDNDKYNKWWMSRVDIVVIIIIYGFPMMMILLVCITYYSY